MVKRLERDAAPIDTEALSLRLSPEPTSVALARIFAGSAARHFACDEGVVDDLKLAISEAVTNAVKAHQQLESNELIEVRALSSRGTIAFEVVDAGPGFDLPPEQDPAFTPPAGLYEGSLGLTMIRALFPAVRIARNEHGGSTVWIPVEPAREH